MSTNDVIDKYAKLINPVSDEATVMELFKHLVKLTPAQQHEMSFVDAEVGKVLIFRHDQFPGLVLEYVLGTKDDSVSTLYRESPIFATRQTLIDTRRALYREIGAVMLALPASVVVSDPGRQRGDVYLYELGTAQLIDTLEHFAKPKILSLS